MPHLQGKGKFISVVKTQALDIILSQKYLVISSNAISLKNNYDTE
jgi:hypothetical protein